MIPTSVTLTVSSSGVQQSFTVDHAERLLRMPNNGGWVLPADSPYEYSVETGLRKKKTQRTIAKTQKAD